MRNAGRYLGAWAAIVMCVVLLSCLFTFLGTITCAVLIGMMMGAFKGARWFSVAVSLVFPGVIFGMVRGARVELTQQQVILLAAVCFGIFWVTYLVSAVVFFCEQKGKKPSELPAPAPQHEMLDRRRARRRDRLRAGCRAARVHRAGEGIVPGATARQLGV